MDKLTDNLLDSYRAMALLHTAHPEYDSKKLKIYLNGEARKSIDEEGLKEIINMSPEKISTYLKNDLPEYFMEYIAGCFECSPEELKSIYGTEQLLEVGQGEECYKRLAVDYTARLMKKFKNQINECMRTNYLDMLALQKMEECMENDHENRTMNLRTTKSLKGPYMWITTIPSDDRVGNEMKKVTIGNCNAVSKDTERFMKNVLHPISKNLETYQWAVTPEILSQFRKEIKHSAEILNVEL